MAITTGEVWTSIKVKESLSRNEAGLPADMSCFHEGDIGMRKANINFEYTKEEQKELLRCAKDIIYFAEKYAYSMTDEGIKKIKLRNYQKEILKGFVTNRFSILMASRQIGKCCLPQTKVTLSEGQQKSFFDIYNNKQTLIVKLKKFFMKLYQKLS